MEMKKYKLGEIATVEISGVDKKRKENETPVKLCNFTDVYHNWAITKDMEDSFMDATASEKEIKTFSLKKGQVAFTKDSETRDDIGIPTYIADNFEDVLLGYHTALITPDKTKLNGKYLNAFMNSKYIQKYFENNASGSGQRYTLSNDTLNSIPIIIPNLTKQKVVGNFFSNIDKKIALNKKINAKLEAMAKRLYDYWFVQFDFPNEEGKPYKTSGGKMVWNEVLKRNIPEGWEVGKMSSVIKQINTGLNPRDNFILGNGKIKYVTVKNLTEEGHIDFSNCDLVNSEAQKIIHERSQIQKGDILFASICPLGRCYLIQDSPEDWDINESVFSIRPNIDRITSEFLYTLLREAYYVKKMTQKATGSIFKGIRINDIEKIEIVLPPKEVINAFSKKTLPIFNYQLTIQKEIQKLTELRDRLLPLLMNGQVEVE